MNAPDFKKTYLEAFNDWEKSALTKDPFWIRETREAALAYFDKTALPTPTDEAWRYADLDPLFKISFALKGERHSKETVSRELTYLGFDSDGADWLVFVNGHFSQALSKMEDLPEA